MPHVSVIVPNYNHARFLRQRMDSILDQTFQDFEVLYLDDASTDNSAEVFAPYASDPRVRALVNTQNTGSPFVQWNRGMREARGEYVWIAESDDYADSRLLETLAAKLDANPQVGLAYCQSLLVDEKGEILRSALVWTEQYGTDRWKADFVADGREECRRFLVRNCTIFNASGVLLRKSVCDAAGGSDETMRAAGDWMLYARMLLRSDIAFVAEPLNFFRQHPQSVIRNSDMNGLNLKEAYQVMRFIISHVQADPNALRAACKGRIGDWHRVALSDQSRLSLQRSMAIYRMARDVDPLLHLRLAKLLPMWAFSLLKRLMRAASPPTSKRNAAPSMKSSEQ